MPEVRSKRIKQLIARRLSELEMSATDLVRKMERDFKRDSPAENHAYKLINGTIHAGDKPGATLYMLMKSLGLDFDEARVLLDQDKAEWKFGMVKTTPINANNTIHEINVVLPQLSKRDQEDVLKYVNMRAGL